jgi:hypothetical protein
MRRIPAVWLLLFAPLFAPLAAWAQTHAPAEKDSVPTESLPAVVTPTASSEKLPGSVSVPAPSSKPAGLDFNFFGAEPSADSAVKDANVDELSKKRRHRLEIHQTLGIATWVLLGASCVVGQLNYNDLYGGGSGRGSYQMPHRLLVYPTAALFTATGIYALLAPTPYPKPLRFDTALVHRLAAIGATAGMLAEVALGFITARQADTGNPSGLKQTAQAHQIVGWTTFGFMTLAGMAWIF